MNGFVLLVQQRRWGYKPNGKVSAKDTKHCKNWMPVHSTFTSLTTSIYTKDLCTILPNTLQP